MNREGFRKSFFIFLILVFLSLLFLGLESQGWLDSVRATVEKPFLGLEERLYQARLSVGEQVSFCSGTTGEQELMRLRGQVRQLAVENSQLISCQEENERMRRLLGAPLPAQWKFLPAKVIGRQPRLKIDQGEKDGVVAGMMVVSENILVGRIESTSQKSALVQQPTDAGVKIPVVVKKPAAAGGAGIQAKGILTANLTGQLVVDRLLQTEDVRPGDLVLTAAEEDWLPDLLLGQIGEVSGLEAEVYKQATVLSLVDSQTLKTVFVIYRQ